jgi:putative intracellular protease/amidase
MVLTGADKLIMTDGRSHPTGFWAEEVTASHEVLTDAGFEVDIATPGGVRPPVDSGSAVAPFTDYLAKIEDLLAKPLVLGDVSIDDYDAIYLPGGHGPMTDLAFDTDLGQLLRDADSRGKIVAALCHGPAGLLSAVDSSGFAFAGRRLTVFTDNEELNGGTGPQTPYFVEARLRELGAVVAAGPAWSSTVVVDGNLITGQNPQSSVATATKVAEILR